MKYLLLISIYGCTTIDRMKAKLVFQEKRFVHHTASGAAGIVEIRVLEVPKSKDYPHGRKFSLFLTVNGEIIVGIDNHKPKGPHLHLGDQELPYLYRTNSKLIADFWDFVRKAGFEA